MGEDKKLWREGTEKLPFAQTFLGATLVLIVGGVLGGVALWFITGQHKQVSESQPSEIRATKEEDEPVASNPPLWETPSQAPPATAPVATATTGTVPSGKFAYNRQIGGFGRSRVKVLSGGQYYTVPLVLETIENDPSAGLSLHFLFENKEDTEYQFHLVRPRETALAIDSANVEYPFLAAQELDSPGGLKVSPFSRRRFVVSFQPLKTASDSLRVDLVFQQESAKGSYLPERPKHVQITDIPLYYLTH
jgi:hypothetical protein